MANITQELALALPWPPSANRLWRSPNKGPLRGRHLLSPEARRYKDNAHILMEALDKADIWYCGGKNAPYLWLRCPDGSDSWGFFDRLLNELQIVGTPGSGFGSCGEGYFRFSTFGSREDTLEAASRITDLLSR